MQKKFIERTIAKIFKVLHLNLDEKKFLLLCQIVRFIIVGVIATAIDFGFLYYFRDILHFSTILANTISFSISVIFNYILSIKWVYQVNKNNNKKRDFILFIIFSVIGLIINDCIVWACTKLFTIYYLGAKCIATVIVMIFNYVTRKKFLE